MSRICNTREARNQFNQLIQYVMTTGEEVLVTKGKKPAVKIVLVQNVPRKLGLLKGHPFWISPDFDEESSEINALFQNTPITRSLRGILKSVQINESDYQKFLEDKYL